MSNNKKPLPIHIPTIIKAAMQLWWFPVIIVFIGTFVSVILALSLGKKVYRCRAIYLYSPKETQISSFSTLSFDTHVSLIKVPSNLEIMSKKLDMSPKEIMGLFDVIVGKKEGMITFVIDADSAKKSYEATLAITEVFIHQQIEKRKSHAEEYITAFRNQYEQSFKTLKQAQQQMQDFIQRNKIIDISKEKQWYLEKIVSVEMELQHAKIELSATNIKLKKMSHILNELEKKAKLEKISEGQKESLTDLSLRKERLRELVSEAKRKQILESDLGFAQEELERLQKMKLQNIVAQDQIDNVKSRIAAIKAQLNDTEQIKSWKKEIEKLDSFIVPAEGKDTQSSLILKDVLLQTFNLQLQEVAAKDKVDKYAKNVQATQKHLDKLAYLQEEYNSLERSIQLNADAVKQNRAMIEGAQLVSQLKKPDFLEVSPPEFSSKHYKSNSKIIAIAFFALFFMVAFTMPLFLAFVSLSCRSAGEAKARLNLNILGTFKDNTKHKHPNFILRILARISKRTAKKDYFKRTLPNWQIDMQDFYNMAVKLTAHFHEKKGWVIMLVEIDVENGESNVRATGYGLSYYLQKMDYKVLIVDMLTSKTTDEMSQLSQPQENFMQSKVAQSIPVLFNHLQKQSNIKYMNMSMQQNEVLKEKPFIQFLDDAKDYYDVVFLLAPLVKDTANFRLCARAAEGGILLIEASKHPFWLYFNPLSILKEEQCVALGISISGIRRPFT